MKEITNQLVKIREHVQETIVVHNILNALFESYDRLI